MEDEDAAGRQHAQQLADVALAVARLHVLKDQRRIGEAEGRFVEEQRIGRRVQVVGAAIGMAIVAGGGSQHRARDVNAVAALEVAGQRLRDPSDAAAEVERTAARHLEVQRRRPVQRRRNLFGAVPEELFGIPAAAALGGIGEDGPERIAPAESIPVAPERGEPH